MTSLTHVFGACFESALLHSSPAMWRQQRTAVTSHRCSPASGARCRWKALLLLTNQSIHLTSFSSYPRFKLLFQIFQSRSKTLPIAQLKKNEKNSDLDSKNHMKSTRMHCDKNSTLHGVRTVRRIFRKFYHGKMPVCKAVVFTLNNMLTFWGDDGGKMPAFFSV